ncbi:alpha/beta fold hydrolase [Roseovarius salis]|uniref:alpha/beta fold hydrolase n=1 Tax=Roseovarius salis TaxID=3376063 RepID=UPI0037CA6379
MISWLLLAAGTAVVAWPFAVEGLRPRMNAARREAAPGQFARLSRGRTHYRWLGPADGPVVVCVHGLTTPSFVWGPIAEGLAAMGCRVLLYDLYGRGFSDRPGGAQDSAFFTEQLDELLEDQGVTGKVTLLGYSMGGAIVTAFAAQHAGRLRRLVLIAPAGLGHDLGPVARLAVNHDWLGRWLTLGFYPKSLRRATEAERGLPGQPEGMVDLQIAETRLRGFAPAILSSLRGVLDEDHDDAHRAVATAGVPVLAIWGEADEVIPLSCRDRLAALNPDADHEVIPGAGHAVAYTHAPGVLERLRPVVAP